MRKAILAGGLAVLGLFMAQELPAQTFPDRSIRLIVPFPPGGTNDAMARIMAQQVGAQIGQSVVVENRPGANGIIGFEQVAKAAPDGYTILHTSPSIVINEFIYKNLRYHVDKDYVPITNVSVGTGYLVLVGANSPLKSIADLVAAAKVKKDALAYGSAGLGNTTHLVAELLNARLGVELLHVPYKGLSESMNAVIAGDVQVALTPPTVALSYVQSGRLRALAFTGAKRWEELPEVPTLHESGLKDFELIGGWFGWFAPKGTPPAIADRLQSEVAKALKVPEVRDFIEKGGYLTDGRSRAEFNKFLNVEMERYGEAVKAAKIEPMM